MCSKIEARAYRVPEFRRSYVQSWQAAGFSNDRLDAGSSPRPPHRPVEEQRVYRRGLIQKEIDVVRRFSDEAGYTHFDLQRTEG